VTRPTFLCHLPARRRDCAFAVVTVALGIIVGLTLASSVSKTAASNPFVQQAAPFQPDIPIQAVFFYPWFAEAWTQAGLDPFSRYTPNVPPGCVGDACYYDSEDLAVVDEEMRLAHKSHVEAFISSWWGAGHHTDLHLQNVMTRALAGTYPSMRFAVYHEQEGQGDPPVSELVADLGYLNATYFGRDNYLRVGGSPVVFVYSANETNGQSVNDRWAQAQSDSGIDVYLSLKVYPGFRTTKNQPDSWHQYGPSTAYHDFAVEGSINVSPGFWKANESVPRLVRDIDRFRADIVRGRASAADWKLVTSWNEWGEGTSIEPSRATQDTGVEPSWFEEYIDVLCDEWTEAEQSNPGCTSATPTYTPAPAPAPAPTSGPASAPNADRDVDVTESSPNLGIWEVGDSSANSNPDARQTAVARDTRLLGGVDLLKPDDNSQSEPSTSASPLKLISSIAIGVLVIAAGGLYVVRMRRG